MGHIIFWVIFLIAALAAEAATFALVSVWFAAGAVGALITASMGGNFTLQLIVFALVSGILLAFTRPMLKRLFPHRFIPTNSELEVGKTAVVTEDIDNETGSGRVKLGGVNWAAVSSDGTKIPEGAVVSVTEVRSAKLAVILKDGGEGVSNTSDTKN
ncbi:MAG: NfeD family protein [Prevotella sp.]|nr:NfeD family protein [Prevotella sp.]